MSNNINKSLILNKLKSHYGFNSDSEFAHFLGIKPQTLSSWHSRNTYDIELLYAKCVNIDGNFLLTGEDNIEKLKVHKMLPNETVTNTVTFLEETKNTENVTQLVNETQNVYNSTPQVVTVDKHGKDNIVLVPVKAAAGYLNGYGDPQFIEKLPTYSLPNINNGTFRMFQVSGHSMHPTLMDKCYVVGEWVENWVKSVKDNRVYVVVCDEGVLVKRVLNRLKKYGNLYLKSDNRKEYPNINIEPERIFEIWEVKMHIATELPDPAVMYDRMNDLEAEMEHIKSLLKRKN